jgi:hypothetical protein
MKNLALLFLSTLCLVGCFTTYSVTTENAHDIEKLPAYCQNAVFVASDFIDASTAPVSESMDAQKLLTMANVLKFAKAKYGDDVTVMNLRYDTSDNGKNALAIAVTFDVVRCP